MREISFSLPWDKLNSRDRFTTFRFPRKDRDWEVNEDVKIVYKARTKERMVFGTARIVEKFEFPSLAEVSTEEAIRDGFPGGLTEMTEWMIRTHGNDRINDPINKLTLGWVTRELKGE